MTNKEQVEAEIADKKEELNDLLLKIKHAKQGGPLEVEPNPPLIRVVEEKKTTEEFAVSPQQKKVADLLCPKISDYVAVEDACKKCDAITDCPQYGEFTMLKKAIRNQ